MGDVRAYGILVHQHEPMLQAYVRALVDDAALADDVCQEAFLRAYRHLDQLERADAFPAWLRSIARNVAFAALARRRRERAVDPEVLAGIEDVFAGLDATYADDPRDRLRAVAECFGALTGALKDCCERFYYRDQATKEIAAALAISLPAVLKRLERARRAIARCLERRLGLEEA